MPNNLLDTEQMQNAAAKACKLLKTLSNPDRLMILCSLTKGERCVSDLENQLGIVQPTLSQQLTVLREDGLVTTRRAGKHIYYQACSVQATAVIEVLFLQFCQQGANT